MFNRSFYANPEAAMSTLTLSLSSWLFAAILKSFIIFTSLVHVRSSIRQLTVAEINYARKNPSLLFMDIFYRSFSFPFCSLSKDILGCCSKSNHHCDTCRHWSYRMDYEGKASQKLNKWPLISGQFIVKISVQSPFGP